MVNLKAKKNQSNLQKSITFCELRKCMSIAKVWWFMDTLPKNNLRLEKYVCLFCLIALKLIGWCVRIIRLKTMQRRDHDLFNNSSKYLNEIDAQWNDVLIRCLLHIIDTKGRRIWEIKIKQIKRWFVEQTSSLVTRIAFLVAQNAQQCNWKRKFWDVVNGLFFGIAHN